MMSPRDNYINYLEGKEYEWIPCSYDQHYFMPEIIPENIGRGFIFQQKPFDRADFGGPDWFGVNWIFDPKAAGMGGSMEEKPLFDDITEWEEYVTFPDLSKYDWEKSAEENAEYLKTDKIIYTTILTSFFERLISFVGFEEALIALVDEDEADYVKKLFDKLADFYIELVGYLKKYYNVEIVEIQDDWGCQRGPLFSEETHSEMIVPYVKKLTEGAKKHGVYIELHSCGLIEPLIPNMISTGVFTWRGQSLNDKRKLVEQYGDSFKFKVFVTEDTNDGSKEVLEEMKKLYKVYKGKKIIMDTPRWIREADRGEILEYARQQK